MKHPVHVLDGLRRKTTRAPDCDVSRHHGRPNPIDVGSAVRGSAGSTVMLVHPMPMEESWPYSAGPLQLGVALEVSAVVVAEGFERSGAVRRLAGDRLVSALERGLVGSVAAADVVVALTGEELVVTVDAEQAVVP